MRRLPIFLLIDVSESMAGENLRALQEGMERLVKSLRADPYALETVYLSVIAFAGRAKTLAPLVELFAFYPPRLPLGSGTSMGNALNFLMDEIDRTVTRSTPGKKGDFKPVVYLMSDGKSTDDVKPALERWGRDFANRANLVALGIGPHAALEQLSRITPNVLRLDARTEEDFKRFIDWISASVSAQSRSVGAAAETPTLSLAKVDNSVMSKIQSIADAAAVDEDFVILNGICQKLQLPYLMKYERLPKKVFTQDFSVDADMYQLTGVFAAEKDYHELSDPRANARTISSASLMGAPGCPHCGAAFGFATCSCGQIFCVEGSGPALCPGCKQTINMGISDSDDGFEVNRSRG